MQKRFLRFFSLLFTMLLIFSMAAVFVRRAEASASTPYYNWKQSDSQWGGKMISSSTVKAKGCLAVSVAMLAVHAELKSESNFDPGEFVRLMKMNEGFASNNNLLWEAIPKAVPGLSIVDPYVYISGTQAQKAAKIKEYYEKGYYIAIAVKNEGHWVALRFAASGAITIMDPGSAATELFAAYSASGVTRLALLSSAKPGNAYSVTYDANGGTAAPAKQYKIHGQTLTLSASVPTRKGFIFKGWAIDANATAALNYPDGRYTGNAKITYYAVWVRGSAVSQPLVPEPPEPSSPPDHQDSEGLWASLFRNDAVKAAWDAFLRDILFALEVVFPDVLDIFVWL
ncbi:MAG: InlB B-repeat-containing protein [Oscillospiraceae bacterium]|nr:InlB B-repeat-containing protein [Oscillospiraceae bacterium]